ncbi:MAG: hypothetical protein NTY06_02645 [Candidatus Gottesmanbacteria bacterium]|nr:hypothetical protein [Candidatus Gottesmanbacteria bacterium]
MTELINESVSVALWSNHTTNKIVPYGLYWHGKRYLITTIGFHHTERSGRALFHIFSVTDGTTFFKLRLDTETLGWKLLEVTDGF